MDARSDLVGQVIDQRYEVRAFLARGGMATVYEAVDRRLDRVVALKVMHPHFADDPEFVARFEREAKAAARLSHPHVVAVFDQGEADGLVYLAMEFVPGRTLRDVLREFGPLTPEQALVLLDPILEALSAAHAAGFVHRDIKPENVLIANDGRVKVADFGLARAMSGSASSATTGMIIGTVAYLSPEQVERGDADERSDIYAAGICLYEMVAGSVPHEGESPLSVAYQHVNSDVPAPSSVVSGISPDVDALVVRSTRRDPALRYPTTEAFLADVRKVRAHLPAPRPLRDDQQSTVVLTQGALSPSAAARPTTVVKDLPTVNHRVRSRKGPWIVLLVVLGVIAAGFGGWWFAAGQTTPAPDVLGLTIVQAQDAVSAEGFTVEAVAEAFSETAPPGTIVATDPAPGEGIRAQGTLAATVSQGPERYAVPDLVGQAASSASTALGAVNLTVGSRTDVFNSDIPVGNIVQTTPGAGESVPPNTRVDIEVSKGPAPFTMGDYSGKRIANVTQTLEAADLTVSITERFDETVAENRVISQRPKPGVLVQGGDTVELVVSKGPPPVTVPNLIDMPRKRAVATLQGLGLKVNVVAGDFTPLNRVISQTPPAGTEIPKGSTVTIRII